MENPYQASSLHPLSPGAVTSGTVTPEILDTLARTKPWIRFFSIMGFILIGVSLLFALVMVAGGIFNARNGENSTEAAFIPIFMGCVSGLVSMLYILPSVKLWKYGSWILRTLKSGSAIDLQHSLEQQRRFWKYAAIILLLSGILLPVLILTLFTSPISAT